MKHAEPTEAGEAGNSLLSQGSGSRQLHGPPPPRGTLLLSYTPSLGPAQRSLSSPEVPENTPCCQDSEANDGFNDEAACRVGLTQEGTGAHPRGALSLYAFLCFDIHVLAEAAVCGSGKLPQGV